MSQASVLSKWSADDGFEIRDYLVREILKACLKNTLKFLIIEENVLREHK